MFGAMTRKPARPTLAALTAVAATWAVLLGLLPAGAAWSASSPLTGAGRFDGAGMGPAVPAAEVQAPDLGRRAPGWTGGRSGQDGPCAQDLQVQGRVAAVRPLRVCDRTTDPVLDPSHGASLRRLRPRAP